MTIRIELNRQRNQLKDNSFSVEEEAEIYEQQLFDVFSNPRKYLDDLHYMIAYRVSWKDYSTNTPTLPKRLVIKRKVYKEGIPNTLK